MARTLPPLPSAVKRAIRQLGEDLRDARRRRRLPLSVVAERALITKKTLIKVERGSPGVSLGVYATILFVLGLVDRLTDLADAGRDTVGLALEEERLPQRMRRSSRDSASRP